MNVRPLRSEADYEAALERIDALMGAKPGTKKGDELEVLVTLVEAYEEKHYPIDPPDPVEAIKFAMEQFGLTQSDLVALLGGSRSRASELLNRKRRLSLTQAQVLHEKWNVPAEALLRRYDLDKDDQREKA